MTIIRVQKNEILPINAPSNATYSFSGGASLIQLLIPESPTLLMTKSLKLNGSLRLNRSTSTFTTPVFPDNANRKGTGLYTMRLNERVGLNSLFQNITISGLGAGSQTLENIRSVGRLVSITNPLQYNQSEFDGTLQGKDPSIASREKVSGVDCNTEVFFSIPIECGMFQGNDSIAIGRNGTRGLQILIQLENNANAIICNEADKSDVFYSLTNLSLSYDTLVYDAATTEIMSRPSSGQIAYNSWAHQFSVLNSNDTQLNLQFGTRNTLSVLSNTIPTVNINNIGVDSYSTNNFRNSGNTYGDVAKLNKVTFGRNGSRVPYDFEFFTSAYSDDNRPRVEVIDALKSVMDVRGSARTLVSVNTENQLKTRVNLDGTEMFSLNSAVSVEPEDKPVFAVGTSLDNISNVGRDYSTATYSVRFETTLDGNSPNSVNTFTLSKNVLSYSPQGISVSS